MPAVCCNAIQIKNIQISAYKENRIASLFNVIELSYNCQVAGNTNIFSKPTFVSKSIKH